MSASTMRAVPTDVLATWKAQSEPQPKGSLDRLTGRPLQFYRSTRGKRAPQYAKQPDTIDLIECSICRYLFLADTPDARSAHRRAHEAELSDQSCGAATCGDWLRPSCDRCGEDVCADFRCQRHHAAHDCQHFQHATTLDPDAADAYLDQHISVPRFTV